ncbi:MAG: PCRF domain-containing protein [Pseudomonadales bacterium]|nr:PCRF domain-containing protein [Pseudomonadales bacterium]
MEVNPIILNLKDIEARTKLLYRYLDYAEKKDRLEEVTRELESAEVWNDPENAQKLGKERSSLENTVTTLEQLLAGVEDGRELLEMAVEENDQEAAAEVEAEVAALLKRLEALEFRRMFSDDSAI